MVRDAGRETQKAAIFNYNLRDALIMNVRNGVDCRSIVNVLVYIRWSLVYKRLPRSISFQHAFIFTFHRRSRHPQAA